MSEEFKKKLQQMKPDLKHHTIQFPIAYQEGFFDCATKVLALLDDYEIRRKPEEWEESVGEAFSKIHDEINRRLMFHGIYENDTSIIIDKKQSKFVVIEKEKLRKLLGELYEDYEEYNKEIAKHRGIPTGTDEYALRIARASKFALIQFIENRLDVKLEKEFEKATKEGKEHEKRVKKMA